MNGNTSNTTTTEDKSTPKTISMYQEQWAVIEEVNERHDFRNLSTALRFIINDYRRMKAAEVAEEAFS